MIYSEQEKTFPCAHIILFQNVFYFSIIGRASPCEAELQELMEQIDIMVSNKKLEWERKMRALETRLDLRDQELANAQTCLDQKGQEVLNRCINKLLTSQTVIVIRLSEYVFP